MVAILDFPYRMFTSCCFASWTVKRFHNRKGRIGLMVIEPEPNIMQIIGPGIIIIVCLALPSLLKLLGVA